MRHLSNGTDFTFTCTVTEIKLTALFTAAGIAITQAVVTTTNTFISKLKAVAITASIVVIDASLLISNFKAVAITALIIVINASSVVATA